MDHSVSLPSCAEARLPRPRGQARRSVTLVATVLAVLATALPVFGNGFGRKSFERIATFPVFLNTCNGLSGAALEDCINETTVAEIITSSKDGKTLIYTDAATQNIGFVNINNPDNPQPAGILGMGGEPTSVGVAGNYALVAVDSSDGDFVNPSGHLNIVHIPTKTIVRTIQLGGQPDAVAISPNERYAAIAIENQRDEDLGDGAPPQLPAGFLIIVDLIGPPSNWSLRNVSLTGYADIFPDDPEVEFVDINVLNIAVVTLQENNHIILVDLRTGNVIRDFSAGTVNLTKIDTNENDLIELKDSLSNVPREPDAVKWTSLFTFATADEGDLNGGSRGATLFLATGQVLGSTGNELEHAAARLGHYPEARSENKGNEPEGIEVGNYGLFEKFIFVGSERSSVVFVYRDKLLGLPELVQVLPAGVGPEGLHAIPKRDLFVVSSEVDEREDTIRASITIYKYQPGDASYPTVRSSNRPDGTPIPWGALSALAAHRTDPQIAYSAYDSFYAQSRIYKMDVSNKPAVITDEIVLHDGAGGTFDFDIEGLAVRQGGGFWAASEGAGNAPGSSLNLLLEIAPDGEVLQQIPLPADVTALQRSNGFEGVASVGTGDEELVYVAFQREWTGDPAGLVRIGRYGVATGDWTFFYYQLDVPTSPNGGWVGLSEIVAVDSDTLAVVERDNQAGEDARIKKIYKFDIGGITPQPQGGEFPIVEKDLVRDLMPDLQAPRGSVIEKVEGHAILANGDNIIVTDNDGTDDSNGETQLIHLGPLNY